MVGMLEKNSPVVAMLNDGSPVVAMLEDHSPVVPMLKEYSPVVVIHNLDFLSLDPLKSSEPVPKVLSNWQSFMLKILLTFQTPFSFTPHVF